VLLPEVLLVRRADSAAVIGAGLLARAVGRSVGGIAEALAVPRGTVRGWLRRFTARAEHWRAAFTIAFHALDAQAAGIPPEGSVFSDAITAMGLAAAAWVRRVGPAPWTHVMVAVSCGRLLSPPPRPPPQGLGPAGPAQHQSPQTGPVIFPPPPVLGMNMAESGRLAAGESCPGGL
jgi:hypothetical protein